MKQYLTLLQKILDEGVWKENRTGVKCLTIFNGTLEHDLSEGFPLLTTRKVFFRGIVEELLFFISGDLDTKLLEEKGVNIWKGNTTREFLDKRGLAHLPEGCMGTGYSFQLRNFGGKLQWTHDNPKNVEIGRLIAIGGFDQLKYICDLLKNDPSNRRIVFTYWNPPQMKTAALDCCHNQYTFCVIDGRLNCHLVVRSQDTLLGQPYNFAQLGLWVHILSKYANLKLGKIALTAVDCHLYENQIEAVKEQLTRKPKSLPQLMINKNLNSIEDIENLKFEDLQLEGYNSYPNIKVEMVV